MGSDLKPKYVIWESRNSYIFWQQAQKHNTRILKFFGIFPCGDLAHVDDLFPAIFVVEAGKTLHTRMLSPVGFSEQ